MSTVETPLTQQPAITGRAVLPALVACAVYAVILAAGDQLLRDPDTYWQVTIGNWIVDHHAVPRTDIYSWTMAGTPWISTQWLAQAALAASHRMLGWAGPVILAASTVALAFALLTRFLARWLSSIPTLALASAAFALTVPHLVARPHVLALPVMVAFVCGLVRALDRRDAPSMWLLPLMVLWANLHGGFVLGLALIAPIGCGAVCAAPPAAQPAMVLRWSLFGVLAVGAACATPYGWESLLAARRILNLGQALALWRGVRLSPVRIVLIVGFVFMALSHVRNAEVLALLAPLVLARPLAEQGSNVALPAPVVPFGMKVALALTMIVGTVTLLRTHRFAPDMRQSPVVAAEVVKARGLTRVLNDYDFGGYLISAGIPTYIDGRTELYGELPMVAHDNFSGVKKPADFFALIADDRVQATLLRTASAATAMLDHLDGWRRVYADDIAVVHQRDPSAKAFALPALRAAVN